VSSCNSMELVWRSSSFCLKNECVEVATCCGQILIRDSAASASLMLSFPNQAWQEFLQRTSRSLPPHQSRGT
jgi:hypothetical protein